MGRFRLDADLNLGKILNMTYHISLRGNVSGPFTLTQLQNMWQSGSVTADSFYWQEGFAEWQPITAISELLESKQNVSKPLPSPMASCKQAEVKTAVSCSSCGHANTDTVPSCAECGTALAPNILATPVAMQTQDADLTTGDWVVCVLCSGIGCILGIIRLIQGKPNASKMIGMSILFTVLWFILRVYIRSIIKLH